MIAPEIPEDEVQRLAALEAMDALFTPAEERFDRITRMAARVFGTPIALISLVTRDIQWFKSEHGLGATETPREISFCGHAIHSDDTLVVSDAEQDPRFFDNPLVTGAPNIRFYAGHPIHSVDGARVGTLCIIDRSPKVLTTDQLDVLRDLAAIAESELQRGQLSEAQRALVSEMDEVKLRASVDGLTRLWNRTALMELLSAELTRARRGIPVCLAMMDVDHFKKVNDTYGHPAGDAVLVEVAARIRRALREYDAVGRYGGEEFIAVMSNASLIPSMKLCQRIRLSIEKEAISTPAGPVNVTISIGLVQSDSKVADQQGLIEAADAALYRAKNNGRNRLETGAPG
ncbi:MAG: sensor domain-containing diguanylate cyclase [Rhodocyclaceae bacterium]|nr:MAG: sensor domain-containing diguanylate cyclase [Rhodocyclaceae bacterium]